MFSGFEVVDVEVGGLRLRAWLAGSGPPVLLLHGYPQTHVMWHRVAPILARDHTVVVADLRGYGDSAKPAAGGDHAEYSKRSMAGDQVALMAMLGFDVFAAAGHDRGGRVVHRMCLDHPGVVVRAAVLDIVPTRHVFATADQNVGLAYYHWFFLAQAADLPERLIGSDPEYFLRRAIHQWSATENPFGDAAVAEYVRCFRDPAAIAASCEDYRAAATIDLEHDEQSVRAGHRVTCPLLVLWGRRSFVGRHYDVLSVWRRYARDVRGSGMDCGHFLAEEQPQATSVALAAFLENDA
jgi:haloacetate dehalogenase